jgi:hypothetical protein
MLGNVEFLKVEMNRTLRGAGKFPLAESEPYV